MLIYNLINQFPIKVGALISVLSSQTFHGVQGPLVFSSAISVILVVLHPIVCYSSGTMLTRRNLTSKAAMISGTGRGPARASREKSACLTPNNQ